MIGNILDNTTELHMIKYTFGEIFSSGGATLYKNPSDQTVPSDHIFWNRYNTKKWCVKKVLLRHFRFCIPNPRSIENFCTGNVHGNLPLKVRKKCIHYEKRGEKQWRNTIFFPFFCDERKNLNAIVSRF